MTLEQLSLLGEAPVLVEDIRPRRALRAKRPEEVLSACVTTPADDAWLERAHALRGRLKARSELYHRLRAELMAERHLARGLPLSLELAAELDRRVATSEAEG